MKKIIGLIGLIMLASIVYAYTQKEKNIVFTAVISEISENNLMVTTEGEIGFDEASVSIDEVKDLRFNLLVGQTIEIEIIPEILESDPVQVIAVNIKPKSASYKKITPEEAKEMMSDEVIILDVRTETEFNGGHIEDAVLIPNTSIKELAPEILPDINATILVYCRSGNRSKTASKSLIEMGYQNVYDFGGINGWTYGIVTPN